MVDLTFGGPWNESNGGVATAVWAPPRPSVAVETSLPDYDEYEVRLYDAKRGRQLVAAIEIVSPANKDRPEHRNVFVAKCAVLLQKGVAVSIVDLVTVCHFNLYAELLAFIGHSDPTLGAEPPYLYAASCRWIEKGNTKPVASLVARSGCRPAVADTAVVVDCGFCRPARTWSRVTNRPATTCGSRNKRPLLPKVVPMIEAEWMACTDRRKCWSSYGGRPATGI